jgi:hypothetical protein
VAYTGDDELYAFLESKGVNIDPREAENYKDIMQEKVDGINSTNQKIKNARDGATFDDIPGATFNSSQIQLDQSSDTQNNIIQGLPTTRDSGATVGLLNPVLN